MAEVNAIETLEDNAKIQVESIGRGSVSYPIEGTNIERIWAGPGIVKKINFGELRDAFYASGGYLLFTNHLLIRNEQARQELELPPIEESILTEKEIEALLKGNPTKLKETMPKLAPEIAQRVAEKAIEMKIDNTGKMEVIQQYTNVDIYKLMKKREDDK